MIEIQSPFAIPVGVNRGFISEGYCEIILRHFPDVTSTHGAITGDAVSSFSDESDAIDLIDSLDLLPPLKDKFLERAVEFAKEVGIRPPDFISNSWINFQREGSILKPHTHPNSVISGALYLHVKPESSPIQFYNPNPLSRFQVIDKHTKYTKASEMIEPNIGTLILFPSWLEHGSETINQTKNRAVISFNTGYNQ